MPGHIGYESIGNAPPSPLCRGALQHTDQVLGLARDLVPRAMMSSPPSRRKGWQNQQLQQKQVSRQSASRDRLSTKGAFPRGAARPANSPLRSYAKGKNSLWLLNSDNYSSVTMKTLIEKQAAAAAHLNSPSRLEAFAADSPPRSRHPRASPSAGGGGSGGGSGGGAGGGGGRGRKDGDEASPQPHRAGSSGGIALSELVSATTPPRRRHATKTGRGSGVADGDGVGAERRSLAQETYTKTFSGMQAYGESGMTVLEELIDAAFRACDVGHAQGQQRVTGAALLTRSGKIFSGCNVESSSADLSVGAERTTVLKAVSEGETRFRSMAMASDTEVGFPSPDGPGRQFLAEFGEFPVYLVNRDMQVKIASTGELYPMMPPDPLTRGGGLGPGSTRDEAIVAASRQRGKCPPRDWGVQEVLDWLEDELELGEYRREFARAKVDGALLLNLEDKDLQDMLGLTHPLHRRRVCLGIQKIKDKEEEEMGNNYADMDEYVTRLDRNRVRLVTKLKVVFDRFDACGTGSISAADARAALEYMGRDVSGEACASWLADQGRRDGGCIPFVDFAMAYSALFADEDPDVELGERFPASRREGVSMTESGHVRLRKKAPRGRDGTGGSPGRRPGQFRKSGGRGNERDLWARGRFEGQEREREDEEDEEEEEEEEEQGAGGGFGFGRRSPPPGRTKTSRGGAEGGGSDGDLLAEAAKADRDGQAFEALRSVKKLAEVKRVFDRFAVDGMLTAYEALQALTEAGCTAPRTHAGRYLRSRRFFGLRREVTFFEFLRSMAALGVHDSEAHVAGFAPSSMSLRGGPNGGPGGRTPRGLRYRRRRRGHHADADWRDTRRGRDHRSATSGSSGTEYDDEDDTSTGDGVSNSVSDTDRDSRGRRSARRDKRIAGAIKRERSGGGGSGGGARRGNGSRSPKTRRGGAVDGGRPSSPYFRRASARGRARRSRSREDSEDGGRKVSTRGEGRSRSHRRAHGGTTTESTATGDSSTSVDRNSSDYRSTHRDGGGRGGRRQEGRGVDRDRDRRDRGGGRNSRERRHDGGRRDDDEDRSRSRYRDRDADHDRGGDRDNDRSSTRDRERPSDRQRRSSVEEEREGWWSTAPPAKDRSWRDDPEKTRRGRETGNGSATALRKGERVEARYRGRGTKFYKGKVARVYSDGTLDIDYDDGEKELGIAEEHVRSLESPSDNDGRGDRGRRGKLSRGDVVEVRYRGKGNKFYKGKISRVNPDGTFDIAYDDGEREVGIAEEHVRSLERSGSGDARGGGGGGGDDRNAERCSRSEGRGGKRSLLREGDRVEGNYRGRGKYYKGRIARVNLDGTFNIDYDDGEKERCISEDNVRSVGEATAADSRTGARGNRETGALQKGDRVEARYRGRGTKFYKGKIKRVNSDGTFDIDYDDGEKELGIAAEHVVTLEQPTTSGSNGRDGRRGGEHSTLQEGDKVEGNYRGRGRFYKGTISRVNLDGTFNIDYDDGEKERGLSDDMIRKEKGGAGDKVSTNLKRGDRVEARYRGKGTKFYKGKIARVNSDATFDVNYDDGEKEIGIAEEHVVSLEPTVTRSERTTGRAVMARGDRVEARYRGRGTKFYKGEIARVNSDGTFDINYDDGEKELGIAEEHVTSLEPAASGGGGGTRDKGGRGNKLTKGDRVEARYRGKGTKFYKGKISRVNSDETFDIAYDDGEKELGIGEEHVRSLETDGRAAGASRATLSEGSKVEANYRGRGRFYAGRISRVNLDGTFNVDYDDGEKERGITDDFIRPLDREGSPGKDGGRGGGGRLQRGDKVEARYRGRGTKFYKGNIVRVNSDATFDIDYDDGEKERGIAEEHVRAVDGDRSGAGRGGRGRDSGGLVEEGDRVEANYRGRGRYYKGRVRRVNRDGTFDIDYDDGEKERGVPTDMVRTANEAGNADRGARSRESSQRLLKGDTVEARYRGRGTKFYKGRIVRVNSDDTFDIDYDDGEKERGIAEEHVRSLVSAHEREGASNASIMEGDKVEANYRGRGRYYKGLINRANRDGTFDVNYDDGEKEKGVRQSMIRPLDASTRMAPGKGGGGGSSPLKQGDRVEARYRGRGTKYYKGKIARVNSDATLDIDYDDGEKEIGIGEEHVKSLESEVKETNSRSRNNASGPILEGDKVEANFRGRGRFYKGRVSRVNLDGTFNIDYDDGEKERGVTDDLIRVCESSGGGGGGGGGGRSASPSSRLKAIAGRVTARNTTDGDVGDVGKLKRGDAVEARYRGRGSKFYRGRIVRVNSDATFDIDYDDGEKERSLRGEHVRSLEQSSADRASDRRTTTRQSKLQRGDKVKARYRGSGTKFFPGRISRVNSDDTFDIDYDDGDKEVGIGEEHVRPLGRPRSGGGDGSDDGLPDRNENLREGEKVEANYRGRGRYYKGRIRRINSNGTFDIDYDDGEKERDVEKGLIRGAAKSVLDDPLPYRRNRRSSEDRPSPGRGGSRRGSSAGGGGSGGGSKLQRGDKVEARYRARGTKFYKGRIARVNSDETFDIDYDDGEKEIGISEEHVRSLEPGAGAGVLSSSSGRGRSITNDREDYDGDSSPPLLKGDRVEGNFQGRGRYYKGRISRQNLDGSFNIDYDDGEKERGVSRGMIRPIDAVPRGAVVTGRRSSSNHTRGGLQRGDRVEARYRGRGTKFYRGRVVRVNSDGTLDIDYDDGDKEVGIAEEHVRETT